MRTHFFIPLGPRSSRFGKRGTALVLVLAVLVIGAGMVAGVQHRVASQRMAWRQAALEVELRGALLLGLVSAIEAWESDEEHAFTHPAESWFLPREFEADNGAVVRVIFRDAQDRFNVNWLSLSPDRIPGMEDSFAFLMRANGVSPDFAVLRDFSEKGEPVETLDAFAARYSEADRWFEPNEHGNPRRHFVALPLPAGGITPLNLNSASEEVLLSLLGFQMTPWLDTLLRVREEEPIRSLEAVTVGLPPPLAARLGEWFSVRSQFLEVRVEAEAGNTLRSVDALLSRNAEGTVEVLRCLW